MLKQTESAHKSLLKYEKQRDLLVEKLEKTKREVKKEQERIPPLLKQTQSNNEEAKQLVEEQSKLIAKTKRLRDENAVFKKFFLQNKAYMEPTYGSMKPEHVQIYTNQILTDLKLAFQGESNYIERGMEYLRTVVEEQLESKNPLEDKIVALKDLGVQLEREF